MTQEEKVARYRRVAHTYIDAVNRKDLDGILGLFATDAVVHDPVGQRVFTGKAELRGFYEGVISRAYLEIVGPIRGSFSNAIATPVSARIPGVRIDVITITTFNEQGLIQSYFAYWGPGDRHELVESPQGSG